VFYVGNDDEEIFTSTDGGATWTEVAALSGASGEPDYLNDIDSYVTPGNESDRLVNSGNELVLGLTGTLTLPFGGTISEGVVTSNPTIQLTPASPDATSQKLVIKGGTNYNVDQNGISLGMNVNTAGVGDTFEIFVFSNTYADQTLYWWIVPEEGGIADPGSGTITLDGNFGTITFTVDSDDYEFTVRVSPEQDNYDPNSIGVESLLINGDAPTFDGDHHLHLTTGDLSETSIFLGTDDHNVRTTVNSTIQITTPNDLNNVWEFDTTGNLTIPGNIRSESNIDIEINLSDSTLHRWQFGEDGSLTLPGQYTYAIGETEGGIQLASDYAVILTVNTIDPENEYSFIVYSDGTVRLPGATISQPAEPTPGTFSVGAATAITVTNSPNTNWTTGSSVSANGIVFLISVDGSGNATVSSISDGGTEHFVGETFGPVTGTAFGGTSPDDDMYFEVTGIDAPVITALDLTKQTQILSAASGTGAYSLADGTEGQIMYFVPDSTISSSAYILVANARIIGEGPTDTIDYSWTPFDGESQVPATIAMAIFADGAWCLRGGASD
jgi:hypothetical protein